MVNRSVPFLNESLAESFSENKGTVVPEHLNGLIQGIKIGIYANSLQRYKLLTSFLKTLNGNECDPAFYIQRTKVLR